jgi:ATP-dependent protease ClpP protease subunit
MRSQVFFARSSKQPDRGEIVLYADIGPAEWGMFDDATFAAKLKELGEVKAIDLRINSAGGSAFTGISIYNQLKRHPAKVQVHVDGLAASIASIIAMAGESIKMGEGARLMIHDASTITWGNEAEMQRTATLLGQLSNDLAEIYARRTGRPVAELRQAMRDETWYSAEEALAAGLADEITKGNTVEAHLAPEEALRFKHPPKDLLSPRENLQNIASRSFIAHMTSRSQRFSQGV